MIVSCGEALIDFLPRETAGGAPVFDPRPGGSPFNVAIAIGRLDASAGFLGGLSTDMFGDTLRGALAASRVDTSLAPTSDRPTTLAFVSVVNGNARYAFYDEGSAGRMLTGADLPALPASVAALHFGSFSLAAEPCGSTFEALMQREHSARVISLDVNVRPTLIPDRGAYLARLERLAAMADIVKLSEEDLAWLDPTTKFESLARRWLAAGAKLVTLTKGAEGAVAISRSHTVTTPGVPVKVADTVGAGDTFTGATLVRLFQRGLLDKRAIAALSERDVADALEFAARAASVTVSRPGADPPWARELA
ncbi:MAG TPA: carbohydrate kinase [Bauldia sp.]|nr:carbohydrate kinase [Bauldia sp.]